MISENKQVLELIFDHQPPLTNRELFIAMRFLTLSLLLLTLLVGCSSPSPTPAVPTAEPTPTPDPRAILRQTGEAMESLTSAQFDITRTGGPVFMDADGLLRINQATGSYSAPDAVQVTIRLAVPGSNVEVQTVAMGETQWITNFLNGQWEQLPPGWGFNPAILFSEAEGWRPLLTENLTAVSPLTEEALNGQNTLVIEATVEGERVSNLTAGVVDITEPLVLKLWLDPTTYTITQAQFTTPAQRGDEPAEWLLQFSNYNAAVTITPPVQ